MKSYPRFTAAACHSAPVYFDIEATVSKAISLIAEAACNGAKLVAFPEAYICAFPVWSGLRGPVHNHDFFVKMAKSTINIPGPEIQRIREAARQYNIVISMGLNEGTSNSVGCIWDTNILIDNDGTILNRHRKLVPTFWEKLTWANGDGSGLRVVDTSVGRIGALICGENTNPLARYSLIAQGEQVHVASYSPRWPTHPIGDAGGYDLEAAIRIRSGAHCFEGKLFSVVSSGFLSDAAADIVCRGEKDARELLESTPRSVSMILGPSGVPISNTLRDEEGIVYGEVDIEQTIIPKQFHDVVGYYNRFDVFDLRLNNSPHDPVKFAEPFRYPEVGGDGAASEKQSSARIPALGSN